MSESGAVKFQGLFGNYKYQSSELAHCPLRILDHSRRNNRIDQRIPPSRQDRIFHAPSHGLIHIQPHANEKRRRRLLVDGPNGGGQSLVFLLHHRSRNQTTAILNGTDLKRKLKRVEFIQVRRKVRRASHVEFDPEPMQRIKKWLQQPLSLRRRDPGSGERRKREACAGNIVNRHGAPIHEPWQILMPCRHGRIERLLRNPLARKRQIGTRDRNLDVRFRRQRPHDAVRPAATATERPVQIGVFVVRSRAHELSLSGHDFPFQRLVGREAVL